MSTGTSRHTPTDPRLEGITMSTEIQYRIERLQAEADARRLFAGGPPDDPRRRLGRVLVAVGRAIEGRAAVGQATVETTDRRSCPPAASARA